MSDPLVPQDVDLRDFAFMPLDVRRLLTSETWILGTGDERAAAMTLWLESWHQVPAGSLPNNDRMLAHLSQCPKWRRVREHALRGWEDGGDGRLYHPVVCEKALEAWIEKLSNSLSGASGNAKRWGVEVDLSGIREQFCTAVDMLKAIAPQSRALKKKIVVTILSVSPPDSRPESPPVSPPDSGASSPPDRKGQGQGQGQGQGLEIPPVTPAVSGPSSAGLICRAMKSAGIADPNPGHPDLLALIAAGATEAEFIGAARTAASRSKGFAYAIGTLKRQRIEASQAASAMHQGPLPAPAAGGSTTPPLSFGEIEAKRLAERYSEATGGLCGDRRAMNPRAPLPFERGHAPAAHDVIEGEAHEQRRITG